MRFVCSLNSEVKKYLNPKTGKLSQGGNFKAFNENWVAVNEDINFISEKVKDSLGLCAWHLVDGKRVKEKTGCIQAGLIIVDIDNQLDGKTEEGDKIQKQELTVAEALELDICKKYLSSAYYSPSSADGWPRFRLVFGLEKTIIDPDFFQWFTRQISQQIPGSDRRATLTVNLFYGSKEGEDLICVTDKYIPAVKIDEAYIAYARIPKEKQYESDPDEALKLDYADTGVYISKLVSNAVKEILEGNQVEDRSFAMAMALKEIIGWCNWLKEAKIPTKEKPLDIAHRAFYALYDYAPELDGKFNRILTSISDSSSLKPAISIAAENGELAPWKKIKSHHLDLFEQFCPDQIKNDIKSKRAKPVNSILAFDIFSDDKPQETLTSPPPIPMVTTPETPSQLINLQQNNRQFSENDIADVIVNNYGDRFLFDSTLDEFFTYDEDQGIWYLQDDQHIKRRIVKTLDTFVTAGVLPKYNAATVSSVYQILKAKMLRSIDGGRTAIWNKGRRFIPFKNGILDPETQQFNSGNHKDLFLRTKLDYDYDNTATCPKFLAWLDTAVGTEKVVIIQAFLRALVTGYVTGEKFLHLIGPGGTGKSTLQQILIALAGFGGTHTSDLETIETNRFETHNLIGKRLLLLTDEASFSKRLDTLKKLTSSSDTLRAERKYGTQTINFKPELLVCIASNEHISSSDISSGLERRRLTIVMDKVVPPSQRKNLINVFEDRIEGELAPELSGIVSWALSMSKVQMRDVLSNPVKHCPTLNTTDIEALVFNNPICAWLSDCCLYSPSANTTIGGGAFRPSTDESERGLYVKNAYNELYASYVNFCKSNGYKHAAKQRFVDRLKETAQNVLKIEKVSPRLISGKAVVTGLQLKPYDVTTDRASYGDNRLPSPIEWASNPTYSLWKTAFETHDKNTN
jgi:P4 family phage/plasmid primase-like protien